MVRAKLIGFGIGAFLLASAVFVLFDFGSGLAITSYVDGEDKRTTPITVSREAELLRQMENGTLDDEYLNNMYFTKDNFKAILEAIEDARTSREARVTEIEYEYYSETWDKVWHPPYTEEHGDGSITEHGGYWEYGFNLTSPEIKKDTITFKASDIESNPEVNPFDLYWQPIYALCQMESLDMYDDEYDGWQDTQDPNGNLVVEQRLDMEKVREAINVFLMQFEYIYDASADAVSEVVTTTNRDREAEGVEYMDMLTTDAEGNEIYTYREAGRSSYKWTPFDNKAINGGDSFETICYTVESKENMDSGYGEERFWEFTPPDSDEWLGYNRYIKKIPTTVLSQAYNGFSSHKWYTEPNTIIPNKFHKKYDEPSVITDNPTKWTDNWQIVRENDYVDVQKFYEACLRVCSSFEWEEFLMILETLPDSELLLPQYTQMYEEYKSGVMQMNRTLTPSDSEFKIGNNVIIGYRCAEVQAVYEGVNNYVMPGYGHFNEQKGTNMTLLGKDNGGAGLSEEEFYTFITSYPAIQYHADSVFLKDPQGMARALWNIQERYDVSALGLFAIAANESAWGTSRICKEKGNFVGWQAYDATPYSSAANFGVDYAKGLERCLELIYKNYTSKGQDTYYKMRYSDTGTHNYCTSTDWPRTNALIRAQFEKFLGIDENRFELDETFKAGELNGEEYYNPLGDANYHVTSFFGPREAPVAGASTNHGAIDMGTYGVRGIPIFAVANAQVIETGWDSGAGWHVVLGHGQWIDEKPTFTRYYHMNEKPPVNRGDFVGAGKIIGYVGSTGASSGPHLHFEVRLGGEAKEYRVNPLTYFPDLMR